MNAIDEHWRPITGFPGYYVSTEGRVLSKGRWGKAKVLAKIRMKGRAPYSHVNLYNDRRIYTKRLAVLVCEAFRGPRPSADHEAAHGNGVHDDDRLSNLRWATRVENAADRIAHGNQVCGERVPHSRLSEQQVREIRAAPRDRGGQAALARQFGVSRIAIANIQHNRTWRHVV